MSAVSPEPIQHMPTTLGMSRERTIRAFRSAALAVALISFIKYAALALKSFADAPHFFLAFLVLPFVVAGLLVTRARRTAAIVFLLFGSLYTWAMVMQLFGGIEDNYWGDYMLVYVGMPVCVIGLVLAVKLLLPARS
jgi:hypothetical protein